MADIIQLLPDHVANQIAAGEVVQRPASVVKELLENSIDAGATDIKLIVKDAGKTLIQTIDNGIGMSATDARLSFERHATSKIRDAKDLFSLETKGFRGEALASIAAIAHVELRTRREEDELGTLIKIEGSDVVNQEVVSTAKGTAISVKNLFYNIPARRNFLKSNTVEMRHIVDEFQRVALAHPAISFSLYHNQSEIYYLPKSNLRQRIVAIFGTKTNEKLVPIQEETDIITITGFVTKPEYAKKKRGEQFFFVNDRFIKSTYLNHAVTSAFEGLLAKDAFPTYFLYLNVPPNSVDVNIHPTKTEIKFEDEKTLYAILRSTIKHSLGQYSIAPVLDFDRDTSMDSPYTPNTQSVNSPTIKVDPNFNPFAEEKQHSFSNNFKIPKQTNSWESLYVDTSPTEESVTSFESKMGKLPEENSNTFESKLDKLPETESNLFESKFDKISDEEVNTTFESKMGTLPTDTQENLFETSFTDFDSKKEETNEDHFVIPSKSNFIDVQAEVVSPTLFDDEPNITVNKTHQIHKKYIVSTIKSGVVFINQQLAHQRILYEEYLENITVKEAASQQLLFPLDVVFTKTDITLIKEIQLDLENIGFVFENISEDTITVSGIPTSITESQVLIIIEQLLEDIKNEVPETSFSQLDIMAKSLAKSLAIKTGSILTNKEQEEIVNKLFLCKEPNVSPFGKSTFISVSLDEIDKRFR
ncbi:DNA mismatch repair endonuclease MutL [Aureivirga marina]|uniref:DNA mismatch repair endonuclease MutL n=1 Tax=Aureivirga marina TaxID=1182451 RepID=UPI0018CBE1AC|nr:DNA mismatch repair endonuclease MutL [Aureivirga marina]